MTYVLNLSHVSLQRGDTQVLSDVSWSTRPRQHWVIVGPNGAGKTTLARVASGRIAPDSGEVTVSETDLSHADPSEIATRVGLSSAAVGAKIVPTQSVLDTVRSAAWGLAVAHDEEYEQVDDERAQALMDIFGVSHLAQREFSTLSEGEAQRVLLARALMTDPEVLILDEPTFGQDRGTWLGLVRLLRAALERGVTLVSITHDPAFVAAMGQRLIDLGQVGTRGATPADPTDEAGAAPAGNAHDRGPKRGARGLLAHTNPVARVLALLVATTPLLITIDPVSAAVAVILELALMPLSGVSARSFLLKATPLLLAAPLGALSMLLYASPGGTVYWQFGPAAISDHSMWLALGIGLRMCAIVLPAIALLDRIDPTDMGDGLAQILHLPARPVLAALAGARMTSLMAADWKALERARRARGVGDSSRIRSFLRGSFSLLVFALRRSGKLATTMEARGFGAAGKRTWARPSRLSAADAVLMVVAIAVPAIALAASIWAGTFALVGR